MTSIDELQRRLAALEERVALGEDKEEIARLQCIYGFYIDNRMWPELAALFCDDAPSIEIGRRGRYVGKQRVQRFLTEVLGGGRWGLLKNEIINHMQLQPVITVAPDRLSAKMRSRAVVQGSSPPGGKNMLWAEGVYENEYVKEAGRWKIRRIWWVPTFYVEIPGFDNAVFQSGPASESFPPDQASAPQDEALGRSFVPFHYRHPFTGASVPSPSVPGGTAGQG
ncbi:MAG TPA: nuclear transport factor 2 family protein [Ideonella sp.]|nr:nuclear transport factor 2 family protein [Ideonella sp.]